MAWVTILTPFFNGIEYFEECYNSILQQTEKEWIWIIGINGHGDDTNLIYTSFKNNITDHRIIIKNYLTKGKVATLNSMMEDVNTSYVALCDCDDMWFPNKLMLQKVFVTTYDSIDVFGTGLQYIGELNHIPTLPTGVITFDTLLKINPIVNSSVIMKKDVCKWEDSFGLEDYDLWFRLLLENKKIFTIAEPYIYHRIHRSSYFNNSGIQDLNGLINHYKKLVDDVTIVTAYYPIKSKFLIQDYIEWLEFWKTQNKNLVFFTSLEYVPLIENLRSNYKEKTKVISLDFDNLEAFKKYSKDFWLSQKCLDHEEYHTYELYAIWYEKKEFVKKAILLNPFNTNKFVWCDAGICRDKVWIPSIQSFPNAYKIPEDKFLVLRITDFEVHDDFKKINCVGGGILAACKNVWLDFCEQYDVMIKRYVEKNKFVGKDQSIIASMIKENPSAFKLVSRYKNFDDFLCWFTLLFYLS
jgi:glycosyltransferase involved in cell wall biosynthesis